MRSYATKAVIKYLIGTDESNSVHFTFDLPNSGNQILNLQIPSNQLHALITALQEVKTHFSQSGLDTGREDSCIFPPAPYDFTKVEDNENSSQSN